jgi:hypothetical protein
MNRRKSQTNIRYPSPDLNLASLKYKEFYLMDIAMPYSPLEINGRFGETCLHLQDPRTNDARK